jgi:TPR repeat protein
MTIGFLVLKTDRHIRTQAAESSPGTRAVEKRGQVADENPTDQEIPQDDDAAPVATRQYQATEYTRPSAPTQVSHMQVTDINARNVLRSLSRYELVGLRRRALYGDDSAAFLMGMAYETGHGVRQDCKAAAQWVSNAAAEGSAMAQYNLGLRYRDGDGVPINTEAATTWLQKAARHQIPGARMALVAVSSPQGQVAASRP